MVAPLIAALLPALGGVVNELVDRAFPNSGEREQKRLEYQQKLVESVASLDLAQMEVNKAEAASASVFVAGWRPFIGWVCGVAFAYHFVLQPFLAFALATAGVRVELPAFDIDSLLTVLLGMLGLGGLRTFEKVRGAAK